MKIPLNHSLCKPTPMYGLVSHLHGHLYALRTRTLLVVSTLVTRSLDYMDHTAHCNGTILIRHTDNITDTKHDTEISGSQRQDIAVRTTIRVSVCTPRPPQSAPCGVLLLRFVEDRFPRLFES